MEKEEITLHSLFHRKVVRVDNLVVKSGPYLRIHEAQTLRFIAANTTIPVPKVHDLRWEDGNVTAIMMDYVPGKPLEEAWDTMDSNQKLSIAEELHSYILQLRALKGEYIGAVDRGQAVIGQRASIEGGPFNSEREFNEFIFADLIKAAPDLLRHYASHALMDDHEIVFTHGDFAPRNILVDEGGRVTAILDWEYAGWYPEHWEYVKALQHLKTNV